MKRLTDWLLRDLAPQWRDQSQNLPLGSERWNHAECECDYCYKWCRLRIPSLVTIGSGIPFSPTNYASRKQEMLSAITSQTCSPLQFRFKSTKESNTAQSHASTCRSQLRYVQNPRNFRSHRQISYIDSRYTRDETQHLTQRTRPDNPWISAIVPSILIIADRWRVGYVKLLPFDSIVGYAPVPLIYQMVPLALLLFSHSVPIISESLTLIKFTETTL